MLRNRGLKFRCEHVHVRVEQTDTPFTAAAHAGQVLRIPIAHGEGNYYADAGRARTLEANRQVIFRYVDAARRASTTRRIPTARCNNIAGICNERAQRRRPDAAPGARLRAGARQRRRPGDLRVGGAVRTDTAALLADAPMTHATDAAMLLERHGLTPTSTQRIVELLGREPNLTELGIFTVMWSEHCCYKSSRVHLKTLPTDGPHACCRARARTPASSTSATGCAAVFKIESHNHPSFIEPFQGAATGVGGIMRDIFTMGARPIAVLDSLRFGPLDQMPRNRRILEGVVAGIARYGNCIGVPTVGGEIVFDASLQRQSAGQRLRLGIARHDEIVKGAASGVGNPVYLRRREDRPRRHSRRDDGVGRVRREVGGEAAERAGRRSVHGEAAARGLPRSDEDRTRSSAFRTWAPPG